MRSRIWEAYGRRDPYFGVLSDPTKHGGRWDPDEFFASGIAHIDNLMRSLRDAHIDVPQGPCLDFGCGVGRLTQALCRYFRPVIGADVAASMIRRARAHNRYRDRCTYVVNRAADLGQFRDDQFAFVHSALVLQHVRPALAASYIAEFFRVCQPQGLVVFQIPSETRRDDEGPAAFKLPDPDYTAEIALLRPLPVFRAGAHSEIRATVKNVGGSVWPENTPTGHVGRILLANHWLTTDGTVVARDDGRGPLPRAVWPGDVVEVPMVVIPPATPGEYILELDLVQELVCWFGDKGSQTLRIPAQVTDLRSGRSLDRPETHRSEDRPEKRRSEDRRPRWSVPSHTPWKFVVRLLEWRRAPPGPFEMHVMPRHEVEAAVDRGGGAIVRAIEDDACGPRWRSWTYVCHRVPGYNRRGS